MQHQLTGNINTARTYSYCLLFIPGKGNVNDCICDSNSFKYLKVKKLIGFLHAFTGCDIMSCFFKQGKNKLIKTLSDDVVLQQKIHHFYDPTVNPDVLAASANDIVSQMYGSKKDKKTTRAVVF